MNFGLTETQQTLKSMARKFLAVECPIAEVRRLAETLDAHGDVLWKKMSEQGWMGLLIPEDRGGFGMSMVEMAVLLEEMGYALLPGPYFSTVLLAGTIIQQCDNEGPKRVYLSRIASGEAKATLAHDNETAKLDANAVTDGYALSGRKLFVPDAGIADFLVVAAGLEGEVALFVVESKTRGMAIQPLPSIDGTRKLYEITFDSAMLPFSSLLARGQAAQRALNETLGLAAAGLAAEMTGGMQRVLEISVEYAKTRKQFGKPIGSFQAVQHHCADMFLLTEGSRSASYYAAWTLSQNDPSAPLAVSVAKAYSSDGFREVGNRGIQVHGGMGFTWENDLHLYYRRAKASEIAFGDATYHRERIARLAVDRPTTGAIAATWAINSSN